MYSIQTCVNSRHDVVKLPHTKQNGLLGVKEPTPTLFINKTLTPVDIIHSARMN